MKLFYLSTILFLFLILYINSEEQKNQEPLKSKVIDLDFPNIDTGRKGQTIPLMSSNFDSLVQGGNQGRWLILFYAESCNFCKKLKAIIDKIIEEKNYKSVNNIRFGSIDLDVNLFLQIRFNISGIPYVLMIENNKMVEVPNFPDEKNIIKYIETEDFDSFTGIIDFKPDISFYEFIKNLTVNSLSYLTKKTNKFLKKYNINYELGMKSCFILVFLSSFIISLTMFIIIIKCFCEEKKPIKKEEKIEKSENIVNENNEEENKNINNGNSNEENKKIIEEKKEKEMEKKLNEDKTKKKEKEENKKGIKKKKKE